MLQSTTVYCKTCPLGISHIRKMSESLSLFAPEHRKHRKSILKTKFTKC